MKVAERIVAKGTTQSVYAEIRKRILEEGFYRPSQRLIEAELAEDLQVGRHIIRMALTRLDAEGLVRMEPNKGATVATVSIEEARDILLAREVLEGAAARLAAERIDETRLSSLRETLRQMEQALRENQLDRYSQGNVRFHAIIYEASGSKKIPELIASLRARVVRFQFRTVLIPGRSERSFAEHTKIFAALEAHDASAAEEAMRGHMRALRDALSDPYFSLML